MDRDLEFELSVAHNALREIGRDDLIPFIKIMSFDLGQDIFVRCLEWDTAEGDALSNALLISHFVHDKTAHYMQCPLHPDQKNLHCDGCGLDGNDCSEYVFYPSGNIVKVV